MRRVVVLYRPVGEGELNLIRESDWRRFPPRLDWQPIFYPVLTEEYATQIARDWNARNGKKGVVTRFAVDAEYIKRLATHQVGTRIHLEYWIPSNEMSGFNEHIVGSIEVIASFESNDNED